jgi:Bacterial TSP3 repeat
MGRAGKGRKLPVGAARGLAALLSIAMTAVMLLAPGERVAAQDLPAQPASPPAAQPTAVPAEPTAAAQAAAAPAEFTAGAPHVHTVAQGLVGVDGPLVWRVREVGLSATGAPESGSSSFTLQRTGAAVIRNELTSRRTRLEAGEATFMPSGDPFLRYAVGSDPSIIWVIELLPPEAAAPGAATTGTVLFTSDAINDYPRGTFDVELQRGILLPGEVSELPPHTGPALMMVTSGRLQATADGGQPAPISAGSGRLVTGALTLRNGDTQPAAFVVAALGEPVDGAEQPAAAAQAAPTPVPGQPVPTVLLPPVDAAPTTVAPTVAPEQVVEPTPAPTTAPVVTSESGDVDGDGLSDVDEAAYGSDPLNRDYDADGLLDGEEVYIHGTDPLNNDSDGDGLLDGEEVNQFGTSSTSTDADSDGLVDDDEIFVYGTAPDAFDTDGDGIGDGEEVLTFGTNPLDPASRP